VRLAALDALSRHGNQPQVRNGLVETLQTQESPLVQVALIDALVEMRDTAAVRQLQRVRQDPNSNPAVRQRAEWAIEKLNRGSL
jgi:HEAT repeat protein